MSRTYRRKNAAKTCSADYLDKWERSYEFNRDYMITVLTERTPEEITKLRAKFHSDRHKEMTTPMWWNHEHHQVPYRRALRDQITKLLQMKLLDEFEAVIFPDWKKPHHYYW